MPNNIRKLLCNSISVAYSRPAPSSSSPILLTTGTNNFYDSTSNTAASSHTCASSSSLIIHPFYAVFVQFANVSINKRRIDTIHGLKSGRSCYLSDQSLDLSFSSCYGVIPLSCGDYPLLSRTLSCCPA